MLLHFFGTCAGTAPRPDRRHVSFAVELSGGLYWFDAGEGCSHTAHCMGVPLPRVRKVFLTHTHMDHVGGLANLFWNIRKLTHSRKTEKTDDVDLYIPNLETWDGIWKILKNTEDGFKTSFSIRAHEVADGRLCDTPEIAVTALHNTHLRRTEGEPWRSFSYLIEAEGRRIVFSGDVGKPADLEPFLRGGCDVLMMETGHHTVESVCGYLNQNGFSVGRLLFIHNGADVLRDVADAKRRIAALYGKPFTICEDATSLEV